MKISPAQSDFLNWSRWVAAWLVVAEHARSLIFVDYCDLKSPGLLAKGFYFLTGFGHEAVIVFFVISGYLVGGKVWSLYRKGRFGWRRYLADRLSRLYAVLLVALLLGAAMDWTGYSFLNKYGLYDQGYGGSIAVLGAAPIERMGWRDFLVNAFFLQTIAGPTYGGNGPLWSLAYEWWYYVLFPGILLVFFRKSLAGLITGAVLTLLLLFVLPSDIIWLFGIWFFGVAAAIVPPMVERRSVDSEGGRTDGEGENRKVENANGRALHGEKLNKEMEKVKFGRLFFLAPSVLLFLVILVLARIEVLKVPYAWQYLLGFAYALVIFSLAHIASRLPLARASIYLADFSYSVYLIHFPVLLFVLAVGFELFGFGIRMPFSFAALAWYGGVFGIAIFVSWIVSRFTEAKTANLRAIFYKIFCV